MPHITTSKTEVTPEPLMHILIIMVGPQGLLPLVQIIIGFQLLFHIMEQVDITAHHLAIIAAMALAITVGSS